jgi:superfamily II DNA/RNA helicase
VQSRTFFLVMADDEKPVEDIKELLSLDPSSIAAFVPPGADSPDAAESPTTASASTDAGLAEAVNSLAVGASSAPAVVDGCGLEDTEGATVVVGPGGQQIASLPTGMYNTGTTFSELAGVDSSPNKGLVLQGLADMGYKNPSSIQLESIPRIVDGHNVLAQAQSGTGKTMAFCAGALLRINAAVDTPQIVIVSPTRELANQNADQLAKVGRPMGVTVYRAVKDCKKEQAAWKAGGKGQGFKYTAVSGTPHMLHTFLKQNYFVGNLLKCLILDEADAMFTDREAYGEVFKIRSYLPPDAQCLCFSATYEGDFVKEFKGKLAEMLDPRGKTGDNYFSIKKAASETFLENIKFFKVKCFGGGAGDTAKATELLNRIWAQCCQGQAIIFRNEKRGVSGLLNDLKKLGENNPGQLSSSLTPQERDHAMAEFRAKNVKVMICTNVLSRGVDIPACTLVINYDMPTVHGGRPDQPDFTVYTQRVGRTGRFGEMGRVINICENQKDWDLCTKIEQEYEKRLGSEKPMVELPFDDEDEFERLLMEGFGDEAEEEGAGAFGQPSAAGFGAPALGAASAPAFGAAPAFGQPSAAGFGAPAFGAASAPAFGAAPAHCTCTEKL